MAKESEKKSAENSSLREFHKMSFLIIMDPALLRRPGTVLYVSSFVWEMLIQIKCVPISRPGLGYTGFLF